MYLLQEFDLQLGESKWALTGFALNFQPLRHGVQRVFFKCNLLFVPLTLGLIYQGQIEHDTNFETS